MRQVQFFLTVLFVSAFTGALLIGDRKHFYRSFDSGFPEGSVLSLFFKPVNLEKPIFSINFYDEYLINPNVENKIPAHFNIWGKEGIIVSDSFVPVRGWFANSSSKIQDFVTLPEILRNFEWWRADLYKFDDHRMLVCVQGFCAGVRRFLLPIANVKSVYVLEAEPENAWYENYNFQFDVLSKPTPVEHFEQLMKETAVKPENYNETNSVLNRFTSFNSISLESLPINARLRIVAWFGANPEKRKEKPKIQFIPKNADNYDGIFTFYHEWNEDVTKGRKSFIYLINKTAGEEDKCMDDICSPTECVTDGSTGEIEHIWIHRLGDKLINVGNVLVGPDRVSNLINDGFPGTICRFENNRMMNLDQPFGIKGLNGATILHASIFTP